MPLSENEKAKVLARLDEMENHARAWLQDPNDPREVTPLKILTMSINIRIFYLGRGEDCGWMMSRIEQLYAYAEKLAIAPIYNKGVRFTNGPRTPRVDALGYIILKTIDRYMAENFHFPKIKKLWDAIPEGGCVQEKDREEMIIYWKGKNGKEHQTSMKSFYNRVSKIKKEK